MSMPSSPHNSDLKKHNPSVVVIAGPNGAGKSTNAPKLLHDLLGVREFVNADTIAAGISAFRPETAAIAAGRIMLSRLKELASSGEDFAFETTLASRSFAPWIKELIQNHSYHFHLIFLCLPDPRLAIARVKNRVQMGGHHVPEETVLRRYEKGLKNFFQVYQPISHSWRFFDSSQTKIRLIAAGNASKTMRSYDPKFWDFLLERYS